MTAICQQLLSQKTNRGRNLNQYIYSIMKNHTESTSQAAFGLSVNRNIVNKEAFNGCQKGFEFHAEMTVDRLSAAIHKGYSISAPELANQYRSDANFIKAQTLILDFDNSIGKGDDKVYQSTFLIEQAIAHPFVQKHCIYGYTSYSHKEEWHKFRLIFLLPLEMCDRRQYKAVVRYVAEHCLQGADMTATSATNIFFGNTNAIDIINNPEALPLPEDLIAEALSKHQGEIELRALKAKQSAEKGLLMRQNLVAYGKVDDTDRMVEIALTYIPPRIIGTGTYEDARNTCFSLAAHYGISEASAIMERHSPSYSTWNATKTCEDYDPNRGDGIKGIGTLFAIAGKFGFKQSDHRTFTKTSVATVTSKNATVTQCNTIQDNDSSATVTTATVTEKKNTTVSEESKDVVKTLLKYRTEKLSMYKLLPPQLAKAIDDKARSLPTSPEMILQPFLSICSGLLGTSARVQVKKGYELPVILWTGIIGDAGGMKTPSLNAVLKPLVELQKKATKTAEDAWKEYEENLEKYTHDKDYRTENPVKPTKPEYRDYFHDQFTMEGLIDSHSQVINRKGFSIVADELAGIFAAQGQYKGGKGNDRQVLLSLKGGGLIKKKIKGDMSLFIPQTAVSITGGIQPDVLKKLMGDRSDDDGLWGRFQWSFPEFVKPVYSDMEVDISAFIEDLYTYLDGHTEHLYTLSKGAKDILIQFTNFAAEELSLHPNAVRNALAKLKGELPAYACVLHILDGYFADKSTYSHSAISESAMKRALYLCLYYWRQVQALHGESDLPNDIPQELMRIVSLSRQVGIITARTLMKKRYAKTADEANQLIEKLNEFDLGTLSKTKKGNPQWEVYPDQPDLETENQTVYDDEPYDYSPEYNIPNQYTDIETCDSYSCDSEPQNHTEQALQTVTVTQNPVTVATENNLKVGDRIIIDIPDLPTQVFVTNQVGVSIGTEYKVDRLDLARNMAYISNGKPIETPIDITFLRVVGGES